FKVASVAGGFPSGQIPMHIKHLEVKYALEQGADEIDFVINQGKFLETDYNYVFDEVAGAKQLCKDKLLKVILETGELLTPENIYKASRIVIEAGADFIKTSTGKTSVSATQQAVFIMCCAISEYFNATGKTIGIKPAGGISMPNQAIEYYHIINHILGENWLKPSLMRFGASRLADKLYDAIKHSI
ncbi:MAG: deoxyribose-phosphate aldolase, partial [Bacteroidota bacterium]|nr:deoxyribose-phosphate aldolase [Bacteroidota bacterium]